MRDLLRGMDVFPGLYRRFGVVNFVVFFVIVFGAFILGVLPQI
jgi:hypothetical protein